MNKENKMTFLFKNGFQEKNYPLDLSGLDNPESIREKLLEELKEGVILEIDFINTKSLSPSFAYESFGKLADKFGENIFHMITFKNDSFGLSKRVTDAISRRLLVTAK